MVSKAREDFPEPERPVSTTSLSRGMVTSMFFKLCSLAPCTTILSKLMAVPSLYYIKSQLSLPRPDKMGQRFHICKAVVIPHDALPVVDHALLLVAL